MSKGYVSMLLDASGSMGGQEERVVSSANEYVEKLISQGVKGKITIHLFDSARFEKLRDCKLSEYQPLKRDEYNCVSTTPLFDAIAKTILHAEKANKKKTIILVDTDGMENDSRDYNKESLKALIEKKQNDGWQFIFLGSDIDAWNVYGGLGVSPNSIGTYQSANRLKTYNTVSISTANYFAGVSDNINVSDETGKVKEAS